MLHNLLPVLLSPSLCVLFFIRYVVFLTYLGQDRSVCIGDSVDVAFHSSLYFVSRPVSLFIVLVFMTHM